MSSPPVRSAPPSWAWRPPRYSCRRSDVGGSVHLAVQGELDVATAPRLLHALQLAEADAGELVLDLRGLAFISACGVHLLLAADRRIRRAGGRLIVLRPPPEVDRLLRLVGAERRLHLADGATEDGA